MPAGSRVWKLYCSEACAREVKLEQWRERSRAISVELQSGRLCRKCGKEIPVSPSGVYPSKFCSKGCKDEQDRLVNRASDARRRARPEVQEGNRKYARDEYHRWKAATPDYRQVLNERSLKARYGLTTAERDALIASRGARCEICSTPDPGGRNWHVDHDHSTGQVRGVLCGTCNRALGLVSDNPSRIDAIGRYLLAGGTAAARSLKLGGPGDGSWVSWKYGLPQSSYDELVRIQNGACAICRSLPGERPLHVDHNHGGSGEVRGLLCFGCNVFLGQMKDDPRLVAAAASYLRDRRAFSTG